MKLFKGWFAKKPSEETNNNKASNSEESLSSDHEPDNSTGSKSIDSLATESRVSVVLQGFSFLYVKPVSFSAFTAISDT